MITYNRYQDITRLERFLQHIQSLTAEPTSILVTDIKAANEFFHQISPLIPFRPRFATQLIWNLMEVLHNYLRSDTFTYFTPRYQDFPYTPYLLNAIRTATYIKNNHFVLFHS